MAGAKELEIDVTYEDDDEDTAVMPLGTIRELLRQDAQVSSGLYPRRGADSALHRRPDPRAKRR